MSLEVKEIINEVMKLAKEKGFGVDTNEINTYEKLALIHSEISEAMQAFRHKNIGGKDGFAEELADTVIRICHLAGIHNIDLEKEIINKMKSNKDRDWDWEKLNETHI